MSGWLSSLRNTGVHALVLGGFSMAAAASWRAPTC